MLTDEEVKVAVRALMQVQHWNYYVNLPAAIKAAFNAVEELRRERLATARELAGKEG